VHFSLLKLVQAETHSNISTVLVFVSYSLQIVGLFLKPCESIWGIWCGWNRPFKLFLLVWHT